MEMMHLYNIDLGKNAYRAIQTMAMFERESGRFIWTTTSPKVRGLRPGTVYDVNFSESETLPNGDVKILYPRIAEIEIEEEMGEPEL